MATDKVHVQHCILYQVQKSVRIDFLFSTKILHHTICSTNNALETLGNATTMIWSNNLLRIRHKCKKACRAVRSNAAYHFQTSTSDGNDPKRRMEKNGFHTNLLKLTKISEWQRVFLLSISSIENLFCEKSLRTMKNTLLVLSIYSETSRYKHTQFYLSWHSISNKDRTNRHLCRLVSPNGKYLPYNPKRKKWINLWQTRNQHRNTRTEGFG